MLAAVALGLTIAVTVAACASDDPTGVADGNASSTSSPGTPDGAGAPTTAALTTELVTTELVTTELATTELDTTIPSAETPTTAPPSEPTGAPGIDDDDAFCSAWARAIGIPQILTIAANFGGLDPLGMARLEVVAAAAVTSAVASLDETLPPELEAEREVWFTRVLGPSQSRAERAVALLTAAGASPGDLSRLESVWLEALRSRDPTSPVPEVAALDAALEAIVDDAALQFDAQVTSWLADPALIVDDSIAPAITAYTREHCPDLSALGIGDDI